jgi:hypothetical protein
MKLEITLGLPTAGAVMEIPVRQRDFQPGVAGYASRERVEIGEPERTYTVEPEAEGE